MRTIEQILIGLRAWACDDRLGDGMLLREAADVIEALQASRDEYKALASLSETPRLHLADDDDRFDRDDDL